MASFVENFKKDKRTQILFILDILRDGVENKKCNACVHCKSITEYEHGYKTIRGYCDLYEEGYKEGHCLKFDVKDIDELIIGK